MIIGIDGSRAFVKIRTGTENYSYQLLKALSKIDRKNQYIVYVRPGIDIETGWPKNFLFKEISWKRFWTQGGLALQTFTDQLDVLFIPSHTLPVIRKPGLKTVVTVHDLGSEYLPAMHQIKQRLYLGFMQKYQLNSATKIIAVSKTTKDDLVKRIGIMPENVTVVYEGYDKEIFRPISALDRSSNYFLFVGTVQPRKNLERVIKAFAIVAARSVAKNRSRDQVAHLRFVSRQTISRNRDKDVRSTAPHFLADSNFAAPSLVIVGSKGWLSDEIYALPKKLNIEKRVKFLGYVPEKDLPALYSNAEALLFPSLFEGFGLPILEAQACGCPVITSNISSMPEIAGKEGAILVDPYSVDQIAEAMVQMNDGRIRGELIKAGFENAKRFSWEKCAKETLGVLEEVVNYS